VSRAAAALVAFAAVALLIVDVVLIDYFGPLIVLPAAVLPLALVGALLIARIPRNPVGWLLGLSGLLFALTFTLGAYGWAALIRESGRLPGGELASAIASASFPPALGCAVLLLLFFPSGRGLGGRWTWLERALILIVVTITATGLFNDAPIELSAPLVTGASSGRFIPNPLGLHGPLGALVAALAPLGGSASIPVVLIGPLSLFVRYRRSAAIEREQIKWLAYSGAISLGLLVASSFAPAELSNWLWGAGAVALGLFPIAIAVAIFRYRLYDIDVLIRRTLIYAAVSAVLLAAYIGGVALFQTLLAPFTAGNGIAVAVSTLAVVALFQPVRRRVQGAVDHRFFRAKYDAARVLDAFSVRLRDEVDLDAVRADLLDAVRDTVQPAHASLWLRR
jgi:hypothetical protein